MHDSAESGRQNLEALISTKNSEISLNDQQRIVYQTWID